MKIYKLFILSAIFALIFANPAGSIIISHNDFGVDKQVLGFDEWNGSWGGLLGTSTYDYPDVDIVMTSGDFNSYVSIAPPIPEAISPSQALSNTVTPGYGIWSDPSFSFTLGTPITAVGAYLLPHPSFWGSTWGDPEAIVEMQIFSDANFGNLIESQIFNEPSEGDAAIFIGLASSQLIGSVRFHVPDATVVWDSPYSTHMEYGNGAGSIIIDNFSYGSYAPIPEPSTLLLLASGIAGVIALRKRLR
jgi:hypothetical protein